MDWWVARHVECLAVLIRGRVMTRGKEEEEEEEEQQGTVIKKVKVERQREGWAPRARNHVSGERVRSTGCTAV